MTRSKETRGLITGLLLISGVCLPLSTHAARPASWTLEASYARNDNVGFASGGVDIKEDNVLSLGGVGEYQWQMTPHTGFTLSSGARYSAYDAYNDLSNPRLELEGMLHYRPRRGFTAPWFFASGKIAYAD